MDDEEDFETWIAVPIPGRRFHPGDVLVIALGLVEDLTGAISRACRDAGSVVAGHINYRVEQDRFRQAAAQEIETMIAGEDGRDG